MIEPCPRCKHNLDFISTKPPRGVSYRPAGEDFWACLGCKTNWTPEELEEAKADQVEEEVDPYKDAKAVFFEETDRGEPGGGSRNGKSRKKPAGFQRGGLLVDDWNLGMDSEYVKKSRPLLLEPLCDPIKVYVKKSLEDQLLDLAERSGLKPADIVRVAVEKKLEKLSRIA